MASTGGTLIGIVGYSPVLDCFPLGPKLMSALESGAGELSGTRVENMTWSPIHIVQQFEDADFTPPARLVMIGASASVRQPGQVQAFRWTGGTLPDAVIQERIYEAVTGIVDIENTLQIGEYFNVWPKQCFTVEADIPPDAFGHMVMAETRGEAGDTTLTAELGFSPAKMIEAITSMAIALARHGDDAGMPIQPKSSAGLVPVAPFARNFTVETRGRDNPTQSVQP